MFRNSKVRKLLPVGLVTGALAAASLLPAGLGSVIASYSGYAYSFGGILKGGPAASGSATTEEVFVRGQDDALWSSTVGPANNFGGWGSRGGILAADPGATSTSATNTDAFVEGVDAKLWQRKETSGTWGAWTSRGGVLAAGPRATNGYAANREDVFVRGGDRAVWWTMSADGGTTWAAPPGTAAGNFSSVGGVTVDAVGAASNTGEIVIAVWGQDGAIWWNKYTSAGWSGWASGGGKTIYAPAVDSCSAGHYDIWVVGGDKSLWHNSTTNSGTTWSGWQGPYGGVWTSNLSAFCHSGTTNVDVFGRGTDNALWRFQVTGA